MFRSVSRLFVAAAVCALALAGCSSGNDPTPVTGWLGPLPGLQQISGDKHSGVYIDRADGAPPPVKSVYLAPVQLTVAPESDLGAIDTPDFSRLRDLLEKQVRAALGKGIHLVDAPGPDHYSLHVALTGLLIDRSGRFVSRTSLKDFLFGFGKAALQSDLRDGPTNTSRAATIAVPATPSSAESANVTWAEVPARFSALAARLAQQIEEAKSALAKLPPPKASKKTG